MKKKWMAMAGLALMLGMTTPAFAAENTMSYELPDLNLTLEVPTDYVVLGRNMNPEDPNLAMFGLAPEDLDAQFEASNIYLNLIEPELRDEIVITKETNIIKDFEMVTEELLPDIMEAIENTYTSMGIVISDHEIYEQGENAFLKIHYHDEAETVYATQYYTMCNYQAMNFTLRSYTGEPVTEEQEEIIKNLVDSIVFSENEFGGLKDIISEAIDDHME